MPGAKDKRPAMNENNERVHSPPGARYDPLVVGERWSLPTPLRIIGDNFQKVKGSGWRKGKYIWLKRCPRRRWLDIADRLACG
jgi:hypothetical protein